MAEKGGFGIPKARIESLSDLIFGLALSIGAFSLISSNSNSPGQILPNILAFGFSFLILMTIWIRYTRLTTVLPIETAGTVYLNVVMLFCVAVEPYLFNLLFSPSAASNGANLTTTYYALDLATLFVCLGYLTHLLVGEEKHLVQPGRLRAFKVTRDIELVSACIFLISILPVFWSFQIAGVPIRLYLWAFNLLAARLARILGSRRKLPPQAAMK